MRGDGLFCVEVAEDRVCSREILRVVAEPNYIHTYQAARDRAGTLVYFRRDNVPIKVRVTSKLLWKFGPRVT